MEYKIGEIVRLPDEPPSESEIISRWAKDAKPMVSVACITFNHAAYIRHALNGVLNQKTRFPFELIIRDDGSKDGTVDVINEYALKYKTIIRAILETENTYSQGVSPQKRVFQEAKGRYIAYCEGDDYWLGDSKLENQVQAMENDVSMAISYHRTVVIDEAGSCVGFKDRKVNMTPDQVVRNPHGIAQVSKIYRNVECLRDGDFPTNGPTGDATLNVFMARFGGVGYIHDCGVAVYRVHSGGVWSGRTHFEKRRMRTASMIKMCEVVLEAENESWIRLREEELCRYLISHNIMYTGRAVIMEIIGKAYRQGIYVCRKIANLPWWSSRK